MQFPTQLPKLAFLGLKDFAALLLEKNKNKMNYYEKKNNRLKAA